jgi:hypothetical protein
MKYQNKHVVLFATHRTGSNYLIELLKQYLSSTHYSVNEPFACEWVGFWHKNNIAYDHYVEDAASKAYFEINGRLDSFVMPQYNELNLNDTINFDVRLNERYRILNILKKTSRNNLYFFKISPYDLNIGDKNFSIELINWIRENAIVICLERKNKIEQLISYAIALKTGIYNSDSNTIKSYSTPKEIYVSKKVLFSFIDLISEFNTFKYMLGDIFLEYNDIFDLKILSDKLKLENNWINLFDPALAPVKLNNINYWEIVENKKELDTWIQSNPIFRR